MISSKTRRHVVAAASLLIGLVVFFGWLPPDRRQAMVSGLLAQRTLVVLLLTYTLVTLSLLWTTGQKLDAKIFRLFNYRGKRPGWMDGLMWTTTQLGNMVLALAIALVSWLDGNRRLSVDVLLGVLSLGLVVETLKTITDRSRPFLIMLETRLVGWKERGKSFPSGHTAQVFFLAALLNYYFDPSLVVALGMYSVAALVGFTRIYVGVHYPRDVLGGAILGTAWGIISGLVDGHYLGAMQ